MEVVALTCTAVDAPFIMGLMKARSTALTYGVEVYTVPAESLPDPKTGERRPCVTIMVRAETAMQAGIGKGYLLALADEMSR